MHASRVPPTIGDGAVLLFGERYHFDRVLYAYANLIDALSVRFGAERSYAAAHEWPALPGVVSWPEPGRHEVTEAWRAYAKKYHVMDSGVIHRIGEIEVHVFLLGRDQAWFRPADGTLTMPDDRIVKHVGNAEPRSAPHLDVFGRTTNGELHGLGEEMSERIRGLTLAGQAKYGLVYTSSVVRREDGSREVFARISFPEEVYGAGEDWLRVRCLLEDGSEVPAPVLSGRSGSN